MTRPSNSTLNKLVIGFLAAALTIVVGWWQSGLVSRVEAAEEAAEAAAAKVSVAETRISEETRELAVLKTQLEQNARDHQAMLKQLDTLIKMHLQPPLGVR